MKGVDLLYFWMHGLATAVVLHVPLGDKIAVYGFYSFITVLIVLRLWLAALDKGE